MAEQYSSFEKMADRRPDGVDGSGRSVDNSNQIKADSQASGFSWSRMFGWMSQSSSGAQKSDTPMPSGDSRPMSPETARVTVTVTRPSSSTPPEMAGGLARRISVKDIANQLRSRIRGDGTDSDMKQYWMPDANAKSCYDCGEKFTTIRRRHHCRICGQIFCSKCCSEEIPGHFISASIKGQLRSCNYCFNYISNYMSNVNVNQMQDTSIFASPSKRPGPGGHDQPSQEPLSVIKEHLIANLSSEDQSGYNCDESESAYSPYSTVTSISSLKRRSSLGFREEDLAKMSCSSSSSRTKTSYMSNDSPFKSQSTAAKKTKLTDRRKKVDPLDLRSEPSVHEPKWVKDIHANDDSFEIKSTDQSSCEVTDAGESLDTDGRANDSRRNTIISSSSNYDLEMDFNADRVSISRSKSSPDRSLTTTLVDGECAKMARKISDDLGVSELFEETEFANHSVLSVMDTTALKENEAGSAESVLEQLNQEYDKLCEKQLIQLLSDEQLPLVWIDVIKKVTRSVADSVRPPHDKDNEEIDVRSFIKIKKIVGGSKSESTLIRGLVLTKSVTHRRMKQNIPSPKILLLSCPLVYQHRESVKFSSLDDVLLQENSYLKNIVAKIYSYRPDVVVVDKTVARTAQDILLDLGITLVCNVKSSILERLSMFTGGAIIPSLDAHIGAPLLGSCRHFYLQNYGPKTLMFFDGCPPEIGCTILLRGSTRAELTKVKKVVRFMTLVDYNWRLERSFLMDAFAMPAIVRKKRLSTASINQTTPLNQTDSNEISPGAGGDQLLPSDAIANERNSILSRVESIIVEDDSDPLRSMAKVTLSDLLSPVTNNKEIADNSVYRTTPQTNSKSATTSLADIFRSLLPQLVLTCSPYLSMPLPYMLEKGDKSSVARFMPQEAMFWSKRFKLLENQTNGENVLKRDTLHVDDAVNSRIDTSPNEFVSLLTTKRHPFMIRDLKFPARKSQAIESLLHDFRARGGLLPKKPFSIITKTAVEKETFEAEDEESTNLCDSLIPTNHQRLAVLMCAYSYSSNASFCIDPSLITMEFYRENDITLGAYLEKYCFKPQAPCGHSACSAPQVEHIRKFCHGDGAVTITLKRLKALEQLEAAQSNIITWSFCQLCKSSSPFVVISPDTWSLSFAKYLQLKINVTGYCRRAGGDAPACSSHSLFQDHFHYFAYKQIVAIFRHTPIVVCEVALPSKLAIKPETLPLSKLKDDLREITILIYEYLSQVLDRLCNIKSDVAGTKYEAVINEYMAEEMLEKNQFKEKIEHWQVELCNHPDILRRIYIQDGLVNLVKMCADSYFNWNSKINEFIANKRKEEKNAAKGTTSSNSLNPTVHQRHTSNVSDYDAHSIASSTAVVSRQSSSMNLETGTIETASSISDSVTDSPAIAQDRLDFDPDKTPFASVAETLTPELQMLNDHNQVFVEAIEALDHLTIEDSYDQSRTEPEPPPPKSPSNSSLSSIAGEVTPGIIDGLSGRSKEVKAELNSDHENFSVLHASDSIDGVQTNQVDLTKLKKVQAQSLTPSKAKDSKEPPKTMKTIINQLLNVPSSYELDCPFSSSEHYNVPFRERLPVVMRDDDPGSQIAYALASQEYERDLLELARNSTMSPHITKKKSFNDSPIDSISQSLDPGNMTPITASLSAASSPFSKTTSSGADKSEKTSATSNKSEHIDLQFQDASTKFYFCAFFAEQFRRLRNLVLDVKLNDDESNEKSTSISDSIQGSSTSSSSVFLYNSSPTEEMYIRSLSKCIPWKARGGKSGSKFCKTSNDRFVLKEMSKTEYQSFLNLARSYFEYLESCIVEQRPTLLAKILGVYKIGHKNNTTNSANKMYLLVMENVFYNRQSLINIYDLKGSERNRFANVKTQEDVVLLDENLMERIRDEPFYVRPHSKRILKQAYENDSLFLSSNTIMDYSMLVGLDTDRREYVCGIIDYVRSFTFDKKLEMAWKLLISQNKAKPTIVAPEFYRERFCEKMNSYFLTVPDAWYKLHMNKPKGDDADRD